MTTSSIISQTDQKQLRASDPKASAFVSANAGSGKTYVLVRRILRLLLEGADPSRILALTYTTAAAANMSIRVFVELSEWVGLSDDILKSKIREIIHSEITPEKLKLARQLFSRAVETPGGLKIQTIHAFCERVLHLFPLEANIPANFEIVNDATQAALKAITRSKIISELSSDSHDPLFNSVSLLIDLVSEQSLDAILNLVVTATQNNNGLFKEPYPLKQLFQRMRNYLNISDKFSVSDIWAEIHANRLNEQECTEIGKILLESSSNDQKIGNLLIESAKYEFGEEWKRFYLPAFLTAEMERRSDRIFITNYIRRKYPDLYRRLLVERDRVFDLLDKIRSNEAFDRTQALLEVTHRFLDRYEAEKLALGLLDFDDLILRTKELLSRTGSQWVLYKLDNGIEHVLLDEAQDTSPDQWEILKLLTEDFYSGESSKRGIRTIFAVGDPKQSIYSFQGAEPKAFSKNRTYFENKVGALSDGREVLRKLFHDEKLTVSFRSTPDILFAVDKVFSSAENYRGLDFEAEPTVHSSQRMLDPGLVEIWQPITTVKKELNENWDAPLDQTDNSSPAVLLANQLSDHIKSLTDPNSRERIFEHNRSQRRIVPGDIIVLVRTRGSLFDALIRSFKEKGLPVAGADRLDLNEHIAVMDLIALGKSVITPEDDLTLATLLKSPLIGFSEDDLMQLAAERSGSLASALFEDTSKEIFKKARSTYENFLNASKGKGPFSFYSFVLGACGGRRLFRSRFGSEADDVIDEFLSLALEYENSQSSSLLRFIDSFSSSNLTVKRDMDSGRNQIRVMTVHGAKGLEAPIVYLPDTFGNSVDKQKLDPIFNLGSSSEDYVPIWSPSKSTDSKIIAELREKACVKESEEHKRLLYVAMTRARDRLYIAGYHTKKNRPKDCWYSIIDTALSDDMVEVVDGSAPIGAKRLQLKPFPTIEPVASSAPIDEIIEVPQWLMTAPPHEEPSLGVLRPSEALEFTPSSAKGADTSLSPNARRRGILIHKLLEYLPEIPDARRSLAALDYLKVQASALSPEEHNEIIECAVKTLNLLNISAFFSKDSRAEIDIAGELRREGKPTRQVRGTIDRIAVTEDTVFIADFKTTASPPRSVDEIPDHIIAQLAIYGSLVSSMFPDKKIRCFVIYTSGPEAIELPVEIVTRALSIIE